MRVGVITREWPPDVYGGAGVHVEHLVAALRGLERAAVGVAGGNVTVDVHAFGGPRPDGSAPMQPNARASARGTRIPATVTPAPLATCASIIWAASIR